MQRGVCETTGEEFVYDVFKNDALYALVNVIIGEFTCKTLSESYKIVWFKTYIFRESTLVGKIN